MRPVQAILAGHAITGSRRKQTPLLGDLTPQASPGVPVQMADGAGDPARRHPAAAELEALSRVVGEAMVLVDHALLEIGA